MRRAPTRGAPTRFRQLQWTIAFPGVMGYNACPHGACPHGACPHGACPHGACSCGNRAIRSTRRTIDFPRPHLQGRIEHRFLPDPGGRKLMPRSSARANGEAAAQATSEKPNVIVFFTDQQRWDSTGGAWQPARSDTQFRPHGPAGHASAHDRHLSAGLWAGSFLFADRHVRHHYRLLSQRHSFAARCAYARPFFRGRGLRYRLYRQVASGGPGGRRACAGSESGRLPELAGIQCAGVHLGRLRYGDV